MINKTNLLAISVLILLSFIGCKTEVNLNPVSNIESISYNNIPYFILRKTTTGSKTIIKWQEYVKESRWPNIVGANNNHPSAIAGNKYYKHTTRGNCNTRESNTITITAEPNLTNGTIGNIQSIILSNRSNILDKSNAASCGDGSFSHFWKYKTEGNEWFDADDMGENLQAGNSSATKEFKRIISNNYNSKESNTIRLNNKPTCTIGDNQTICYNSKPNALTTTATFSYNTVVSQKWQLSTNGIDWKDIIGFTSSTLQPNNLTTTTHYRKRIETSNHNEVFSNVITITVNPELTGGKIGTDQTIYCNSIPFLISGTPSTGGSGSYYYVWQKSEDGGNIWLNIGTAFTENYQPEELVKTTSFKRQVIDSNCGFACSNIITVTVSSKITPEIINENQSVNYCSERTALAGDYTDIPYW